MRAVLLYAASVGVSRKGEGGGLKEKLIHSVKY